MTFQERLTKAQATERQFQRQAERLGWSVRRADDCQWSGRDDSGPAFGIVARFQDSMPDFLLLQPGREELWVDVKESDAIAKKCYWTLRWIDEVMPGRAAVAVPGFGVSLMSELILYAPEVGAGPDGWAEGTKHGSGQPWLKMDPKTFYPLAKFSGVK